MPDHVFAIRAQQADIDAVHRRPAHQPDCRFDLAHALLPFNIESCGDESPLFMAETGALFKKQW
jgi:hypothetical protein